MILKWYRTVCENHASSLINIEKTITNVYSGDDVNVITAELALTKTRSTYFYKKHKKPSEERNIRNLLIRNPLTIENTLAHFLLLLLQLFFFYVYFCY